MGLKHGPETALATGGWQLAAGQQTAGLGVPTFTLLAKLADWRWGLSGATTAWYRSMRLLRNTARDDWSGVAEQAAQLIAAGELPPRLGAALASRPGD
jgi:hypothetical protein